MKAGRICGDLVKGSDVGCPGSGETGRGTLDGLIIGVAVGAIIGVTGGVGSRVGLGDKTFLSLMPVLPKPCFPRFVVDCKWSTFMISKVGWGISSICAMRSPLSIWNSFVP